MNNIQKKILLQRRLKVILFLLSIIIISLIIILIFKIKSDLRNESKKNGILICKYFVDNDENAINLVLKTSIDLKREKIGIYLERKSKDDNRELDESQIISKISSNDYDVISFRISVLMTLVLNLS